MYCSTCGAPVVEGRSRCDTCGTAIHRLGPSPERVSWATAPMSATCPRCGYRGEGITSFTRGTHVAALVGITLLTAGMMGAGGLAYYLLRRDHLVCPRCGNGWGKEGLRALLPMHQMGGTSTLGSPTPAQVMVRGGGGALKQGWAVFFFLLAALLTVVAIGSTSVQPLLIAGIAAGGGFVLQKMALNEREQRRQVGALARRP